MSRRMPTYTGTKRFPRPPRPPSRNSKSTKSAKPAKPKPPRSSKALPKKAPIELDMENFNKNLALEERFRRSPYHSPRLNGASAKFYERVFQKLQDQRSRYRALGKNGSSPNLSAPEGESATTQQGSRWAYRRRNDTFSEGEGLNDLRTQTERFFNAPSRDFEDEECNEKSSRRVASNLAEYYLSGGKLIPPVCEDFIGPVKIKRVGANRGRGLVLTADVSAGDLLLVSNPLAKISKVETEVAEGEHALETGCWTGSHVLADQLVSVLSARAWRSSYDRELLSTLCCQGGEDLVVPSMKLFQNEPHGVRKPGVEVTCGLCPFDRNEVARICGVVQCNAFGHTGVSRKNEKEITRSWSCGIWMLPSFMNHSCKPNVGTVVVGDAMIVVAARGLKCGEELTVAYFDIFRPLKERRISMLHSWNFVCTCRRCTLEEDMNEALMVLSRAYSFRETEAAITLRALHMRSPQDNTWCPCSVVDLAQLAEHIEQVLYQEPGLTRDEKNWIRASFLSAFLADGERYMIDVGGLQEPRHMKHVRKTHIEIALEAAEAVTPGHPQTLQIAAVLHERAIHLYGKHSFLVKKTTRRALNICMRLFGAQRVEAFQKIVEAAAMDVLSSSIIFLSRP